MNQRETIEEEEEEEEEEEIMICREAQGIGWAPQVTTVFEPQCFFNRLREVPLGYSNVKLLLDAFRDGLFSTTKGNKDLTGTRSNITLYIYIR